ncbi:NfeD family protein [Brevibacillus dissolubilis]|uniref:NfeD family protein n=1 Tax=Brevibacillus dissolubilis TaxID=1844116 RepID=UPI0011161FFA|nr:NfeD family protein [Brevibacillus dissolubilis]
MGWLEMLFLICILFGLVYAIIILLFGDHHGEWLGHFQVPVLQPISLVNGIAAFGGSGLVLRYLTPFHTGFVVGLALLCGVLMAFAAYFIWVRPMRDAETSTGYSVQSLIGKIAEVHTTIPAKGHGEVLIPMINGTTHHIAASLEGVEIREGAKVIVVTVEEHVLYVMGYRFTGKS